MTIDNDLKKYLQSEGVTISSDQIGLLSGYIDELLRWNTKINLTAITDRKEIVELHLLDSLLLLKYLEKECTLLDMGSGGGFPAIPVAIGRSTVKVTSVDSVGKKINFQKQVKRKYGLNNLEPIHSRIETLPELMHGAFEYVTARAVTSLSNLMHYAYPFLRVGGELLAMKGPEADGEVQMSGQKILDKGYELVSVEKYNLPESLAERRIIRLKKVS